MPSSKNYKRDSKQEYKTAKARGENGTGSDSSDAKRKRARRAVNAERKAKGLPPLRSDQHVDHKKPISKGGSNDRSNLRITSESKNTSYARNKDGSIKKKRSKKG